MSGVAGAAKGVDGGEEERDGPSGGSGDNEKGGEVPGSGTSLASIIVSSLGSRKETIDTMASASRSNS